MSIETKSTYWPAGGKMLARITQNGNLVCIFKSPPTDEWGHAMAAALAAPVVERQDCSALMKIAADLANRHPLRQLYLVCEHQGRINTGSLHEHLDKCGDLLAGIALDIRRAITSPPAPVAVAPDKYDDVLLPFLALMRNELHANAGKGDRPGWLSMTPGECLLEIYYHLGKLQKGVKDGNSMWIKEYSADVANMSMILADICACLDRVKELNQ